MLLNELLEKKYCSVERVCSIGVVSVPKERNVYNALRKKYYLLAQETENHFSEIYNGYTNCNDILMNLSTDFQKSIGIVIESMKNDLISLERYDLDFDTIYQYANENGYLTAFYEAADTIYKQIISVNEDLEAERQYREMRKENRARWEGGSFGGSTMDNYLHQADLGMRNVAEGMGHSVINGIGNSISKMAANAELKEIFNNPETRKSIQNGVFEAAFYLHYALIQLKKECRDDITWEIPDETAENTGQRLLNNLKSGAVPSDKSKEIYQKILALNPYSLELFENMLKEFGDERGELGALADYYGIDLQHSKDNQALQYVMQIQGETEEDSVIAKEKLIMYCKTLSLPPTDELDCMQYINKRLEDFDLQYRTVDGVVCTTRDAADFAREELVELQEFLGNITPPTPDSLLDYEEELLERKTVFEESFNSELKLKYMGMINRYLEDFDKKFCKVGLIKKADRKQAGKIRLLKMMKKADTTSLEKVDEAYKIMKEILPRLGLNEEDTEEAVEYLEKQKDSIINPKSTMNVLKGFGKFFKK